MESIDKLKDLIQEINNSSTLDSCLADYWIDEIKAVIEILEDGK